MFRRLLRGRRRLPAQTVGQENYDHDHDHDHHDHDDKTAARSDSLYRACLEGDGPVPVLPDDWQHGPKPRIPVDVFRARARQYVEQVREDERHAQRAWTRMEQLYAVFQVLQAEQVELEEQERHAGMTAAPEELAMPPGDGLARAWRAERSQSASSLASSVSSLATTASLLTPRGTDADVALHDFDELTAELPEGFSPQMFSQLGNALFSEMRAPSAPTPSPSPSPTLTPAASALSASSAVTHLSSASFQTLGDQLDTQAPRRSVAIPVTA